MNRTRQWIRRSLLLVLSQCLTPGELSALPEVPTTYTPVIIQPADEPFRRDILLDNLQNPWAMDFLPDGNLLITEHGGSVILYSNKHPASIENQPSRKIADFSERVAHGSPQLGLLDVGVRKIDDDVSVYFSYTASQKQDNKNVYTTCLMRQQWIVNRLVPREEKTFCVAPWGKETSQFGGAIAFDKKDQVFLTVGDRGIRETAQDPSARWGKILAFIDSPKNFEQDTFHGKTGKQVWSIGHRNPQGLFYDKKSRKLYASEHGPEGGDEINIIEQGKNYGWPTITYGHEYHTHAPIGEGTAKTGLEQPLYYYDPSIATSGIMVYHGKMFPEWDNHIFVGALAGQHLNHLVIANGKVVREERFLRDLHARVRDVKQGPEGAIYVLLEKGILLRLTRAATH